MSRPTKLNAECQAQIIKALSMGATRKDAALSAGVWYTTFQDWLKRGEEEGKGAFYKFYLLVARTEGDLRAKLASTILKAGAEGDWRASQAYLRMRDPENWIERTEDKQSGEVKHIITVEYIDASTTSTPDASATDDQATGETL
jgi:hypothetical protein